MHDCTIAHHKAKGHIKPDADHWRTALAVGMSMPQPSLDKLAQAVADVLEPPLDKA